MECIGLFLVAFGGFFMLYVGYRVVAGILRLIFRSGR